MTPEISSVLIQMMPA